MVLLGLVTAAYVVAVFWLRRARRSAATLAGLPRLPPEDSPPESAIGWPPEGTAFLVYVDEGIAALDAYLSEGFAT